jgi:hypothetical protein
VVVIVVKVCDANLFDISSFAKVNILVKLLIMQLYLLLIIVGAFKLAAAKITSTFCMMLSTNIVDKYALTLR